MEHNLETNEEIKNKEEEGLAIAFIMIGFFALSAIITLMFLIF